MPVAGILDPSAMHRCCPEPLDACRRDVCVRAATHSLTESAPCFCVLLRAGPLAAHGFGRIYDFAGQQEYYVTHHVFLTERALYLLAFDLSKYKDGTYNTQVDFWLTSIQDRVPGSTVIVVGTHADAFKSPKKLQDACAAVEELMRIKKNLLVNPLEDMQKQDLAEIKLLTAGLLKRGRSQAAMQILRADKVTVEKRSKQRAELLNKLVTARTTLFAVSSMDLQGVDHLVDCIKETVQDKTLFPTLDEEVPAFYMAVKDIIRSDRKKKPFMTVKRYFEYMATELKTGESVEISVDQIAAATRFMHDLGEILYYHEFETSEGTIIPGVVFLDVSYLIDAFKFIVRHDHQDATVYPNPHGEPENVTPLAENDIVALKKFVEIKQRFLTTGLLDGLLLERLWACARPHGIGVSKHAHPEIFDALVQLLQNFEIAAKVSNAGGGFDLMVPEFEPLHLSANNWIMEVPRESLQAERYFHFSSRRPPPRGIVQRFQVKIFPFTDASLRDCARDGMITIIHGCTVFCQATYGKGPEKAKHGFQIIVRGKRAQSEAVWKTCITASKIFALVLDDGKGGGGLDWISKSTLLSPTKRDGRCFSVSLSLKRNAVKAWMCTL